jgi:hypothetical protein
MTPGRGLYQPPEWLTEWEKGIVGTLGGSLLDLDVAPPPTADKGKAWWEEGGRQRGNSTSTRPRRAEAFDGEYDDTNGEQGTQVHCGGILLTSMI